MNGSITPTTIATPNVELQDTPDTLIPSQSVPLQTPPEEAFDTSDNLRKIRDTAVALLLSHKLLKTQSIAPLARKLIGTTLRYGRDEDIPDPYEKEENPLLKKLDQAIDPNLIKIPTVSDTGVKLSMDITEEKARRALEDPNCFATFLIHAAKNILGPEFPAWEPGTLWLTFKKENIILPDCNRDKLMASICVIQRGPQFFWDASVFEKTCLAFNNEEIFPYRWENQFLGFLCWGITEVDGFQPDTFEFDYEVIDYIAATAQHQGLLLLPEKLDFAQERLNELNKNTHMIPQLKEAYQKIKKIPCDKYFEQEREELDNLSILKLIDCYQETQMKKFEQQMKLYMK